MTQPTPAQPRTNAGQALGRLHSFMHWLLRLPAHVVPYEADWCGLVAAVEQAHGHERGWNWNRFDLPFWQPHIARVVRDLHEGHEQCEAEVFALSAEVECYSALRGPA